MTSLMDRDGIKDGADIRDMTSLRDIGGIKDRAD